MPKNTKERAALVKAREDAEQLVEDARDAVADALAEVRNAQQRLNDAWTVRNDAVAKIRDYDLAAKAKAPLGATLLKYLHMISKKGGLQYRWTEEQKRKAVQELHDLGFAQIGELVTFGVREVLITDLGRAKLCEEKARVKKTRTKPTKGR